MVRAPSGSLHSRRRELVGGFLFHHSQHSVFPARRERQSGLIVERGGVDALADRRSRDYLPAIGIHHRHHLVVAATKTAAGSSGRWLVRWAPCTAPTATSL